MLLQHSIAFHRITLVNSSTITSICLLLRTPVATISEISQPWPAGCLQRLATRSDHWSQKTCHCQTIQTFYTLFRGDDMPVNLILLHKLWKENRKLYDEQKLVLFHCPGPFGFYDESTVLVQWKSNLQNIYVNHVRSRLQILLQGRCAGEWFTPWVILPWQHVQAHRVYIAWLPYACSPNKLAATLTWLSEMLQSECPLFRLLVRFRLRALWINFLILQVSGRALYVCTVNQLLELSYSESESFSYTNMSGLTVLLWTQLPIAMMCKLKNELYLRTWCNQQISPAVNSN